MNGKKFKFYFRLYWIKIVIIVLLTILGISLAIFIAKGIRAWNESESYLRQSQLAMVPLQLYMQLIMSLMFGAFYT